MATNAFKRQLHDACGSGDGMCGGEWFFLWQFFFTLRQQTREFKVGCFRMVNLVVRITAEIPQGGATLNTTRQ